MLELLRAKGEEQLPSYPVGGVTILLFQRWESFLTQSPGAEQPIYHAVEIFFPGRTFPALFQVQE